MGGFRRMERGRAPHSTRVNMALALVLLLAGVNAAAGASSYATQWRLVLPWADPPGDQSVPPATYNDDRIIAFAGLEDQSWTLVATSASGATAGQLLWTTELPLGSQLPSTVAIAGDLAVLELDGRVFALHPENGSIAWNATSPCSLGDPRMVNSRDAFDAVYLICNELSGDSTVVALHPADGSTSWALSTSSLAAALTPVRAAAAAEGLFIYSDTGSTVTALDSAAGALLWQLDVGRLPSTTVSTSVTHLALVGEVLLVREFSAGLNFSAGPFSYLAFQLNGTEAPALLWAAGTPEQRDRLPDGVTEASPIVAPAVSAEDDLLFYWSAAVSQASPPPPLPPLPPIPGSPPPAPQPSPADGYAVQWIPGDASAASLLNSSLADAGEAAAANTARSAAAGQAASSQPAPRRRLLQDSVPATAPAPAAGDFVDGLITGATEGQDGVDLVVASPDPSAQPPAGAAQQPSSPPPPVTMAAGNATVVYPSPSSVAMGNGGVGITAPEGLVTTPVLKARSISTGLEVWSLALTPVSAPTAAAGGVAVVTPEGLQVLDGSTGALVWAVDQPPIGIYPYAPALLASGAAAVRNCLNTLAPNSLCIYSEAGPTDAAEEGPVGAALPALSLQLSPPPADKANATSATSGAAAAEAGLPVLLLLAAAALPLLLL